jgi:hypothetical protein
MNDTGTSTVAAGNILGPLATSGVKKKMAYNEKPTS